MSASITNDFPFEVLEEALMPPPLDAAIRDLLCTCFPADENVFRVTRHWHGSAPAYSLVHRQGAEVYGHVGVVARTIRCGSHHVTVAGVQNVAVHPAFRGRGLGPKLMSGAMEEARRRGIDFGLLFCVPALERYYKSIGWHSVSEPATMMDEHGFRVLTSEKNICMTFPLKGVSLPRGNIDLQGRDW